MPSTWRVTQSPVASMDWAAWAWVASASSSSGGVKVAETKMMSQRPRRNKTWARGQGERMGAVEGACDGLAERASSGMSWVVLMVRVGAAGRWAAMSCLLSITKLGRFHANRMLIAEMYGAGRASWVRVFHRI